LILNFKLDIQERGKGRMTRRRNQMLSGKVRQAV
jgi:hypothetical protein